jgi:hypothetical protein
MISVSIVINIGTLKGGSMIIQVVGIYEKVLNVELTKEQAALIKSTENTNERQNLLDSLYARLPDAVDDLWLTKNMLYEEGTEIHN